MANEPNTVIPPKGGFKVKIKDGHIADGPSYSTTTYKRFDNEIGTTADRLMSGGYALEVANNESLALNQRSGTDGQKWELEGSYLLLHRSAPKRYLHVDDNGRLCIKHDTGSLAVTFEPLRSES